MAFTSGTATDYLDLLNRLKQFVTAGHAAGQRALVGAALGAGAAGGTGAARAGACRNRADQRRHPVRGRCGLRQLETARFRRLESWRRPSMASTTRAVTFYALLMASAMPYWIVANGRRIVDGRQDRHLLRNDAPGPVPALCHAGPVSVSAAGRWHVQQFDALEQLLHQYRNHLPKSQGYSGAYYAPTGRVDRGVGDVAEHLGQQQRECPDGSYPLLPFILNGLGEMDGCYAVPGYANAAENIITRRRHRSSGGAGRVSHRLQRLLGIEARVR